MKSKKNFSPEIRCYESLSDDFEATKNQGFRLEGNYEWIYDKSFPKKIFSSLLYALAWSFGALYCKLFLHVKIKKSKAIKDFKGQGFFLYGNHTQPVGDVFIPALVCGTKHIYTICSPSNLGLAIIGKLLPIIAALPIPDKASQLSDFKAAVFKRIEEEKCVVIYPEAHVWEYFTEIRPFSSASFYFPCKSLTPCFCMTTTYQQRRHGTKPKATVYIDGPFYPDERLKKKQRQEKLKNEMSECMKKRSQRSNYEYIVYKEKRK
ncbi:MAG: hypothetical protein LUE12_04250 [Ruminococcus sp.]|nr:hypothetical protein [Ruminococcus sp.]